MMASGFFVKFSFVTFCALSVVASQLIGQPENGSSKPYGQFRLQQDSSGLKSFANNVLDGIINGPSSFFDRGNTFLDNSITKFWSRSYPAAIVTMIPSIGSKRLMPDTDQFPEKSDAKMETDGWCNFKTPLIWPNIIAITIFHLVMFYAMLTYRLFHYKCLTLWGLFLGGVAGFGVTGGAHRYWTHKTYKANLPLRIILMISYLVAGENTMFDWVRDHRVHHKFSETDADPHDSRRGFFFSHVGWLMMKKHPEVLRRGRQIDMSDVLDDPVVQFSQKYFTLLKLLFCFVLPTIIPVYLWNQEWYPTIMSQVFIRYGLILNSTWSVNSFAHLWGYRPYDASINPAENMAVALVSMGEGWHNYHHTFPWDYKAAELGSYQLNWTTWWIDLFAKIGWAWDRKSASEELIKSVTMKKGDGRHPVWCGKGNKEK